VEYFDIRGYLEFVSLVDSLKRGERLGVWRWERLIRLPGYRAVFRSLTSILLKILAGLSEEFFRKCLVEAFYGQGGVSPWAEYVRAAYERRAEVEELVKRLRRLEQAIARSALDALSGWLAACQSLHIPRPYLGVYLVNSIGYPEWL